jgi:hypothetical protein
MTVGEGDEGNKVSFHTFVDTGFPHKGMVDGYKGCGVSWNQSTHLQCEKPQVCPSQMVGV